jgi:hypothetical protein
VPNPDDEVAEACDPADPADPGHLDAAQRVGVAAQGWPRSAIGSAKASSKLRRPDIPVASPAADGFTPCVCSPSTAADSAR